MNEETRASVSRALAIWLVFGFVARGGGEQDSLALDPDRQARVASIASRIRYETLDLSRLKPPIPIVPDGDGSNPQAARAFTFDFTSTTVSYLVYTETDSGGVDFTLWSGQPERPYSQGASASFVFPGSDSPIAVATHSFNLDGSGSAAAQVKAVRRTGAQPASGVLDLNLFILEGCGLTGQGLSEGLSVFADIFASAQISLGQITAVTVTGGSSFLSPSSRDPLGSLSRQLTANPPNPWGANLFFIKSFSGIYGFSQGIPAALGIPGTTSGGVVIVVDTHNTDRGFDTAEFGNTMAHETAHSMGLFHTSERDGSQYDTIRDTPRCGGGPPLSSAGCPDGLNFMFWSGTGNDMSTGQAYVLRRSPVVR